MAFDRSNPADLLALKNEVTLDPLGMGYDANGSTQALLDLLNLPENNLGLETGPDLITADKLLEAVFGENISSQDQFKIQLAFEISSGPDADLSESARLIGGLAPGLQTAVDGIIRTSVIYYNQLTGQFPDVLYYLDGFLYGGDYSLFFIIGGDYYRYKLLLHNNKIIF